MQRIVPLILLTLVAAPATDAAPLRVHVVDVGQGDSVLVRSPAGRSVLIDGGTRGDADAVRDVLRDAGIERLDLVVMTHAHADHAGGLIEVVEEVGTRRFLDPGWDHGTATYRELLRTLEEEDVAVKLARAGRTIDLGGEAHMRLLAPEEPLIRDARSDANANSVVARLRYDEVAMLLPGDAEPATLERLLDEGSPPVSAEVLKVAHHGSRHGTTPRLLERVDPELALISCGRDNRYDHPHEETLTLLSDHGTTVYRTDRHGTITLRSQGEAWHVTTAREGAPDDEGSGGTPEPDQRAPVALNAASAEELETLPEIGEVLARRIVAHRAEHGPFDDLDDLDAVDGIGPETLDALRERVRLDPSEGSEGQRSAGRGDDGTGSPERVALNAASAEELEPLPEIGEVLARRIVTHRAEHGPFDDLDDLDAVDGIGPETLDALRERVRVEPPGDT